MPSHLGQSSTATHLVAPSFRLQGVLHDFLCLCGLECGQFVAQEHLWARSQQ